MFGRDSLTHVLSYEIKIGRPIKVGKKVKQVVRHLCGNSACCAPEHLEIGSCSENGADMVRHGRCFLAKLTEDQVREIRATHGEDGLTHSQRAAKYKISKSNLRLVELRRTHKHVT